MSHGVHAVQHEVEHKIQHDEHGHGEGGGHEIDTSTRNKRVALLIAVIALFLAFSETMGKSAQTNALNHQIEASNLWNFFQAKNIRRTLTLVAGEEMKVNLAGNLEEPRKAAMTKQIDDWSRPRRATARSPRPPAARAKAPSSCRAAPSRSRPSGDIWLAKYHHYEVASAAFQIGIVLASATVITGMLVLKLSLDIGLGFRASAFMAIGLFAPHAVHLF